jgi:hypothetical protein
MQEIPQVLISTIAEVFSDHYTHAELDLLMRGLVDLHGEPEPVGNKIVKCKGWLNVGIELAYDGFMFLGKVIEEFMESDKWRYSRPEDFEYAKDRIRSVLEKYDLAYSRGGLIISIARGTPTRRMEELIRKGDQSALNADFERTLKNVQQDPESAVTSACSLLESLFRVYISDEGLEMPQKVSIKPLWGVVQKHLGLDPAVLEDDDLRRILSGLSSIVDGIGSLRTHAGSAHGHGRKAYRLKPRHALLAAHAAWTLASFVIETWSERN